MSRRSVRLLPDDMLEATERIERYVAGMDQPAFLADEKTSDAVVRHLEILGEAAAHVPDEFGQAHRSWNGRGSSASGTGSSTGTSRWTSSSSGGSSSATCPLLRRDFAPFTTPSADASTVGPRIGLV
jgi:hypothetical protein